MDWPERKHALTSLKEVSISCAFIRNLGHISQQIDRRGTIRSKCRQTYRTLSAPFETSVSFQTHKQDPKILLVRREANETIIEGYIN